jgi:putative peptidoglycan lipid II flippase
VKIASPTFYALHESRTPVLVSTASVFVNVALNLLLVRRFGYLGLAVGTSVTAFVNASVLLWFLRRRIGGLDGGRLLGILLRTVIAAAVMAAAAWGIERALAQALPGRSFPIQAVHVLGGISGALAVLLLTARLLRLDEMTDVIVMLASRIMRSVRR